MKSACVGAESLAVEIYKFQAGLTPLIMSDLFTTRENKYSLRNFQALKSSHKRTVTFGTEPIAYWEHQIWSVILERLKTLATLNKFEKEMKKWKCDACPCTECAKHTFNILALLTKESNVYFSPTPLL